MDAKELRLGNYVNVGDKLAVVFSIQEDGCFVQRVEGVLDDFLGNHMLSPVRITNDWLLKFGFSVNLELHADEFMLYFYKGRIVIKAYTSDDNEGGISTGIECVHELQNLYNALTGRELKIKPNE